MPTLTPTLTIMMKDLRQRLRDRSLPVFALVVPLGLAMIYSLVFGNAAELGEARFAVADRDGGPVAAAFVQDVLRPMERDGKIVLVATAAPEQAIAMAERGEVAAAFVIPAGFSAAVASGGAPQIEIVGDAAQALGVTVARAVAKPFSTELHAASLAAAVRLNGPSGASGDPGAVAAVAARAARAAPPVTVADVPAVRRELDMRTYFASGMAVFFLFFTVQFGVMSLYEERRDGTLARLLAAPVPRRAVIAGKLIGAAAIGVVSTTVLIVATTYLLGARWGNPAGVALLVVSGVLAATGVMAVVATLARTIEQAGNWQTIIAIVMGMLGGVFFPVAQANPALAAVSYLTPHRWFLLGLADLSGGGSAAVVIGPVLAMLAFAAATGTVAVLRSGRMLRP
jgi:ABC-2 type transport system permease protein